MLNYDVTDIGNSISVPKGSEGTNTTAPELKRSVSPSQRASQTVDREEYLVSIGSNVNSGSHTNNNNNNNSNNNNKNNSNNNSTPSNVAAHVRGSLTLLKTKAALNRRRRTVAEIESTATEAEEGATDFADEFEIDNRQRNGQKIINEGTAAPPRVLVDLSKAFDHSVDQHGEGLLRPRVSGPHNTKAVDDDMHSSAEFDNESSHRLASDTGNVNHHLNECPTCSRKFNPDAFGKHVKVCEKVFIKKRKEFDSASKRVNGNPDLQSFIEEKSRYGKNTSKLSKQQSQSNMSTSTARAATAMTLAGTGNGSSTSTTHEVPKWKAQSIAFRAAMKSARDVTVAIATGAPLPPPPISAPDPSLVQCPHCERRFNETAAERHIPQCRNIRAKPSMLVRGGGTNASKNAAISTPVDRSKRGLSNKSNW